MTSTEQCEHLDCDDNAVVTLVDIRSGNETSYCLDHGEEALQRFPATNVGDSL